MIERHSNASEVFIATSRSGDDIMEGDNEWKLWFQDADQSIVDRYEFTRLLLRQGYVEAVINTDPRVRSDCVGPCEQWQVRIESWQREQQAGKTLHPSGGTRIPRRSARARA